MTQFILYKDLVMLTFWNIRSSLFFLKRTLILLIFIYLFFCSADFGAISRPVTVRVNRWLAVQQQQGQVTYHQQGVHRAARTGDRLQAVGDGITTGQRSKAVLEVDTGIGFIQIAEHTEIRVRSLGIAPDNGQTTSLDVPRGQVRLQLRRFTHKGSNLEIFTPAGVSAVRGTEFGVSVQPNGKTGLATLTGAVATSAQGKTVLVGEGFQNFTIPGQPPSAAVPLKDNTELRYQVERQIQAGIRSLRLIGIVDPVDLVLIGSTPQTTDQNGRFSVLLPAVSTQTLQITVITPLGRKQVHTLVIQL